MTKYEEAVTIRVYSKDWKALQRIFPAQNGESLAMYLRRYIQALKDKMRGKDI